jgi:hypothetical protein
MIKSLKRKIQRQHLQHYFIIKMENTIHRKTKMETSDQYALVLFGDWNFNEDGN